MDDLPPQGSMRRSLALWFWALFSVAFLAFAAYRFARDSGSGEFPLLATIGGVFGLIGIWRWIAERSRDR